jgi:hypothetical protein
MSKFAHIAEEIRAISEGISNAELGAAVKAQIAKEHPAPTPYEVHGLPDPTDIVISDEDRNKAFEIIDRGAPNLLIEYVRRNPPTIAKVTIDVASGETTKKIMRGEPIGVLVAFKDDGDVFIGYSKYNFAKNDAGVQMEKLVFTKKDALNTAILRALTDDIDTDSVPFKVAAVFPAFLERAKKYFGVIPTNVINTVGFA